MTYNSLDKLYPNPGLSEGEKGNINDRRDSYRVGMGKYPIQVAANGDKYLQVELNEINQATQVVITGKIIHIDGCLQFTLVGDIKPSADITTTPNQTKWDNCKWFFDGDLPSSVWECRTSYSTNKKPYFEIKGFKTTVSDFGLFVLEEIIYVNQPIKTDTILDTTLSFNVGVVYSHAVTVVPNHKRLPEKPLPNTLLKGDVVWDNNQTAYGDYRIVRGPTMDITASETAYIILPWHAGRWLTGDIILHRNNVMNRLNVDIGGDSIVVRKQFHNSRATDLFVEDGITKLTYLGRTFFGLKLKGSLTYTDVGSSVMFIGVLAPEWSGAPGINDICAIVSDADVTVVSTHYSKYVEVAANAEHPYFSTPSTVAGFSEQSDVNI